MKLEIVIASPSMDGDALDILDSFLVEIDAGELEDRLRDLVLNEGGEI